jgi:hypothetical protein
MNNKRKMKKNKKTKKKKGVFISALHIPHRSPPALRLKDIKIRVMKMLTRFIGTLNQQMSTTSLKNNILFHTTKQSLRVSSYSPKPERGPRHYPNSILSLKPLLSESSLFPSFSQVPETAGFAGSHFPGTSRRLRN